MNALAAYLMMGLLTLACVAWLLRPWWGRDGRHALDRRSANIAAYRARQQEIASDLAAGLLDEAAAAQMREEQAARLLDEAGAAPAPIRVRDHRAAWLVLLLPLFAVAGYLAQDSWQVQRKISIAASDPETGQRLALEAMAEGLTRSLRQQPDDAEGWVTLGRIQASLARFEAAATAYERANQLTGLQNPDWLVAEGEALAMTRARDLSGRPQQRFEAALALVPDHPKALWYAGLAAAQARDLAAARDYWQRLAAQDVPPELRRILDQGLAEWGLAAPPAQNPAPAPVRLDLHIELAPALRDAPLPPGGGVLMVFARAVSGPAAPLAVRRIEAPRLPLTLHLDDSHAMLPTLKLSGFPAYILTARLSATGTAEAQSGDLEGRIELQRDQSGERHLLRLDRRVP
ncbi:MAG: c-type cytochrome biogenesis protein CcmI [Gammaproteobacteria bacterium]